MRLDLGRAGINGTSRCHSHRPSLARTVPTIYCRAGPATADMPLQAETANNLRVSVTGPIVRAAMVRT
jgi:hypothetical protein